MSDDLKNIYKGAGALDRFFENATPVDLYRGKLSTSAGDLMQPTLIGWVTKRGPRHPDVLLVDGKAATPQYVGKGFDNLATESKQYELTTEILRNADQYVVKGCRTMDGKHRGVSVFDKCNRGLRGFVWFLIPANSGLPDALAVTQDEPDLSKVVPNHYTIAPKDDMPLSLFLQYLKGIEEQARLVNV